MTCSSTVRPATTKTLHPLECCDEFPRAKRSAPCRCRPAVAPCTICARCTTPGRIPRMAAPGRTSLSSISRRSTSRACASSIGWKAAARTARCASVNGTAAGARHRGHAALAARAADQRPLDGLGGHPRRQQGLASGPLRPRCLKRAAPRPRPGGTRAASARRNAAPPTTTGEPSRRRAGLPSFRKT